MSKDIFQSILSKAKNSNAIMLLEEKKTYKDFYERVKVVCSFLKKNLKKNEIICVHLNYSLDFIALIFASYINKNPITFINPNAAFKEIKHVIKNSNSKMVIHEKKNLKKKDKKFLSFNYYLSKSKKKKKKNLRFIIYTSGTTSKSKGVMLSTRAISSNVYEITRDIKMKKKDRGIIFSPPAYAMGLSQILSFMLFKCSFLIYNSGLRFPNDLKIKIINYKISILNISVSAFKILFKNFKKQDRFLNIRLVMAGGMQFSKTDHINYKKKFPNSKIINFYGCTENAPRISHHHVKSTINYKGIYSVGKALKGVKIKIFNTKNKNKDLGNIYISGNSLMNGYLDLDYLNKKKIVNGWFDTGDLGLFDKKKFLYLVGRDDNTFRVGHEKLCPEELELEIKKLLKLEEVIVSKIKDNTLGWVPVCVFLKKEKKKIADNFFEKMRISFSSYKIPKRLFYLEKFAKTTYGKIDRKKIDKIISKLK